MSQDSSNPSENLNAAMDDFLPKTAFVVASKCDRRPYYDLTTPLRTMGRHEAEICATAKSIEYPSLTFVVLEVILPDVEAL